MPYHTEFRAGVERFLGQYAVGVAGGMASNAHGLPARTVQQVLAAHGFAMGARRSEVSLAAPRVHAYFDLASAAQHRDTLPFSRDELTVSLGDDDGTGTGVPVYLIPYAGRRAMGVRLPGEATDGLAEAWAMTATQNGCTVEISGDRASPYASHTNVIDATAVNRRTKMATRLDKLQQRFVTALGPGPIAPQDDPTQNRVQFGFFAPTALNPSSHHHGYQASVDHVAAALDARTIALNRQIKGGRVETGWATHTRYHIAPTQTTINTLRNPANPPNALVVGHRTGGQWSFYYQEYATMRFEVREVRKIGPKLTTHDAWLTNHAGTAHRTYGVLVVLSHGRVWPGVISHDQDF
jgi:hypothetical protein